jgi:hypothetical protein
MYIKVNDAQQFKKMLSKSLYPTLHKMTHTSSQSAGANIQQLNSNKTTVASPAQSLLPALHVEDLQHFSF